MGILVWRRIVEKMYARKCAHQTICANLSMVNMVEGVVGRTEKLFVDFEPSSKVSNAHG